MVRGPGRHLAHARELLDLQEPLPQPHTLPDVRRDLEKEVEARCFSERQQAQLYLEAHTLAVTAPRFHVDDRPSGLRLSQEVLQLIFPVRWDRPQPMTENLAFCKPVKTFRRRVPFCDAQFEVVERHRAGRGFQKMPIVLPRSAKLLLAATALAENVPGRPCRKQ